MAALRCRVTRSDQRSRVRLMGRSGQLMTVVAKPSSAAVVVQHLRRCMISGELVPGTRLAESSLTGPLGVSRNTLREAFSTLIVEGLLVRRAHRGVFVVTLTSAQVADIYRVRVLLECAILQQAPTGPPRAAGMRAAVEAGKRAAAASDWPAVGTATMHFHEQIVALGGSPRLDGWARGLTAELRLACGAAPNIEALHQRFVSMNDEVTTLYEAGKTHHAAAALRRYLQPHWRRRG